jgi:hypothetical protein
MKKTTKNWKELQDGDIFYFDTSNGCLDNEDLNGIDYDITGTDQIFIRDDYGDYNSILVNGGHSITFNDDDTVEVIGHYSKLIR